MVLRGKVNFHLYLKESASEGPRSTYADIYMHDWKYVGLIVTKPVSSVFTDRHTDQHGF